MNIFKKKLFILSLFFSLLNVIFLVFEKQVNNFLCDPRMFKCLDKINLSVYLSLLFFSLLFFSILFLFQKNKENFEKWKKFSFYYYLLYIPIVLLFPWYIGDGFLSFQKSDAALLLVGVHFLISLFFLLKKFGK